MPSPNGYHNAGGVEFGADGFLYISLGDGECKVGSSTQCFANQNDNSKNLAVPNGKILRIGRNGSIPPDNPYANAVGSRRCMRPGQNVPPGTGPCKEIYAYGLRNPFRFTLNPSTNQFYINDVGSATWEETAPAPVETGRAG